MIDYKLFIEDNFQIKNKEGLVTPFILNDTQLYYYNLLLQDYPQFDGIRENILKFRQPGISSIIDAIFTVDFIMSEEGKINLTDTDIVSHKEKETKVLFDRVDLFLNSYFQKSGRKRKEFLKSDNSLMIEGHRGSQMHVQTANAKVSGRGGTKQNIHWSEVGFYPNTEILSAEDIVIGAEQQVLDGKGKIFRESTGNISGDFFSSEYERGKNGEGEFKSRFFGWWIHKEYTRIAPDDWIPPREYTSLLSRNLATVNQCYWHFKKILSQSDEKKTRREYPIDDTEAFLMGGDQYFDTDALLYYMATIKKPITEGLIYV